MIFLYTFGKCRLRLPETKTSAGWSQLSFQTRSVGFFALFTLSLILYYFLYFNKFATNSDIYGHDSYHHIPHIIPALMESGQKKLTSMLSKQSQTLEIAVNEYRRRYSLDPPDGFDDWFNYAQSQNVVLVDEYDELMSSLSPFYKLGSEEVRRRTDILNNAPTDINLLRISSNGAFFNYNIVHAVEARTERTLGLISMLQPVAKHLGKRKWKEFDVAINELAESRVLGGEWLSDVLDKENRKTLEGHYLSREVWERHSFGEISLIESVMKACGPESSFTKAHPTFRVSKQQNDEDRNKEKKNHELTSAAGQPKFEDQNWLEDIEVCNHPELTQLHSAFRTSHCTTRGLYPILSFGAPSAYNDILFPTSYQYGGNPNYTYIPDQDKHWEEKENGLYWRGSPTGGGIGDKEFGSMHRHRLVTMTNPPMPAPPNGTILNLNLTGADAHGNILTETISKTDYDDQFTNVTFVGIEKNDCSYFECDHLNSLFKFGEKIALSEVWKWKYVIDVDGWGYSARWRALIGSKSLALKSTIYHEWYTERMVPWVHFVPISPRMNELYDVLGYFIGGGEGAPEIVAHDEDAKRIAEAGKKWVENNMRREDMVVYVWRLMLEMNRLNNGMDQVYKHPTTYGETIRLDDLLD